MTSLHFLYWVYVNGNVNRFIVVATFEGFQFRFYDFLDFIGIVVTIEFDENLFYVLVFNP